MKCHCPSFRSWSVTILFVCWWKPGTYMSRENVSCTLWDHNILVPPFVWLCCDIHYNDGVLSSIQVATLIWDYIIFSNLFLIGFCFVFMVFSFLPLICFSIAEECTCIIILPSIYLPKQTQISLAYYQINSSHTFLVHNCNLTRCHFVVNWVIEV